MTTKQINKLGLAELAVTLKQAGCPPEDAKLVRDAFWRTLTRKNKPAPKVYIQPSLFD